MRGDMIATPIAGLLIDQYLRGDTAQLSMDPYVRAFKPPRS